MGSVLEGSNVQGSNYSQRTGATTGIPDGTPSAGGIAQAGKEQAKQLGGAARGRVISQVDSRKGELVKGIQGLVSSLETVANNDEAAIARPLLTSAVGLLRKTSDRLENGTTEELLADAQEQVRQRPGLFVVGCVAVGFALGRFIKV
jgi:phage-related protein